jgi:hypothetical protein
MKIEDNRHTFPLPNSNRQNNDARFQELFQTFSEQFEEESKIETKIDTTVKTAFYDSNLT